VFRFSARLVRPYWRWLVVVLVTMVVETAASLAQPWPLTIVLDSVFGTEPMPPALRWLLGEEPGQLALLDLAVAGTVAIALLQAGSAYLNAYYTSASGIRAPGAVAARTGDDLLRRGRHCRRPVVRRAGSARRCDDGRRPRRVPVTLQDSSA
jgi:ABC-type multidrug transport system fused ATPase/permease subunit